MRRTNALKEYLEFLTTVYHPDNEKITVEWTSGKPHADTNGDYISINPNIRDWIGKSLSDSNELRILTDTVSHEVEHILKSNLKGKKEFMESHPNAPETAGAVYNILEDVYIDYTRTNRWKGLRVSRAFFIDKSLSNSYRHPKLSSTDTKEGKLLEGLLQVALSGYAKGINEIEDEEVKNFLGLARRKARKIRSMDNPSEREKLIEELTHTLLDIADIDKAEEISKELDIPTGNTYEREELDFDEESSYTPQSSQESTTGKSNKPTEDETQGSNQEDNETTNKNDSTEDSETPSSEDTNNEEGGGSNKNDEKQTDGKNLTTIPLDSFSEEENTEGELNSDETPQPDNLTQEEQGNTPEEKSNNPISENIDDEIDKMEERDKSEQTKDWHGVSDNTDIESPNPRFEEKIDELRKKTNRSNTSMAEKRAKRDEHSEKFETDYKKIVQTLKEKGLDDEIERAFKELKNSEKKIPTEMGEEVNLPNAIEYRAGDYSRTRVHEHTLPAEYGERSVTVVLDLSSSMPEKTAKVALLGLQKACKAIGDQFAACGFKTFNSNGHTVVYTPLITGPNEDFQPKHLSSVFSGGATPLPSGLEQGFELVEQSTRPEQVMIVITDGKPNVNSDGGKYHVLDECKVKVNTIRSKGVKVIGMGFGSVDKETMKEIFGQGGFVMGDIDNLADRLLEVYREQMRVVDEHEVYR